MDRTIQGAVEHSLLFKLVGIRPWIYHTQVLIILPKPGWNKEKQTWSYEPLKVKVKVIVAQSCPTLCDPMDCGLPGSSVHGILQAGILEWVAMPFSMGPSQPFKTNQNFYFGDDNLKSPRSMSTSHFISTLALSVFTFFSHSIFMR